MNIKIFHRGIFLLLCVFSSLFMQSCRHCNAGPTIRIENYHFKNVFTKNAGREFYSSSNDSLPMSADDTAYFRLIAQKRVEAAVYSKAELFACSPSNPMYYGPGDSLEITVLDDFDADYPAGSVVNDIFLIHNPRDPRYAFLPLNNFNGIDLYDLEIQLVLLKKPVFKKVRFKFSFYSTRNNIRYGVSSLSPIVKFN